MYAGAENGALDQVKVPLPREKTGRGNFPWIYKITEDYQYQATGWQLKEDFDSEWLHINREGVVTVKANQRGYAWDGCTPKWSLLNLWVIGVPDGHVNYRTMQPYTYYASLVHDALYQYLEWVPVSKREIDRLFLKMMGDFKLRYIYYAFVRLFGGLGVRQRNLVQS